MISIEYQVKTFLFDGQMEDPGLYLIFVNIFRGINKQF
jgi:hypothetical protein